MKKLLIILSFVILCQGINSQWFQQTSGTTNVLTNIYFVDANTGTAIGLAGTIRRTTNGGANWTVQTVPADNLFGIFFLNASTGFICGDAVFYKTTNGGASWFNPGAPVKLFRGIYFFDANTGYLCSTGGEIDHTTDGGVNWVSQNSNTTQNFNNIYFFNSSTGFISGYTGTIVKTTNGGANWNVLTTGITDHIFAFSIISESIIYAGGENGKLIKTTDGGTTWSNLNSGITGRVTNFSFLNANTGTGSSHSNFIIRTTNGGISWVSQVSPVAGQDWYGVSFVNVQTGFIAGDGGNIIKTINGGFQIPGSPNLTLPVNGALNVSLTPLLDWDSIATAKTYQVQIDEDTNYTSPNLDSSLVLLSRLNIPSGRLNNNIRYYWRVRGQSEGGIGPWSANFNFRTIVALPNAPGLITPVNGASNVSLNPFFDWDSTSPADSYTLQAALDTSFTDPLPVWTSGIIHSFLNLVTPSLQNNLRYYWRVNATNIAGTGPWSSVFNFTTLLGMPAAPTLLTPANFATGVSLTPLLDWVEDISATSYQVQIAIDSTFAAPLWDTTGFNVSQVPVRAGLLTNVQTYFWRVRTTNPIGTGPWAQPFRFMTLLIPPIAPTLVDPTNGAIEISTTPTLNWDSVQYAATFRVQLSTDSTFTIPHLINAGGLTFSQYNVPGGILNNNTVYYWRVNASNNAGTGPYSQVWRFRTVISPPVAAPTLLAPPNGSINQPLTVTLDWNDVFGTAGYKLLVSSDSLFNTTLLDTTIVPSLFAIPAGVLNGSSVYYWRVRGFNVGGFGPWSVTWRFTTQIIGIEPISTIIPDKYMLYNNYPNPFNPVTNINFDIPSSESSEAELVIYDITGRIVTVLVNSSLRPGKYSVRWNASGYSSGVYFYRLTSGSYSDIKKMVVVK
ncbi:MAG: T9SS type A sorting domain-containing protein [Ignavibacteria bacterium]|nr:T9SS type A sorting domain-containing protein [Ignavibacteria bacterium]